jgi:hypothetical protein
LAWTCVSRIHSTSRSRRRTASISRSAEQHVEVRADFGLKSSTQSTIAPWPLPDRQQYDDRIGRLVEESGYRRFHNSHILRLRVMLGSWPAEQPE